jgi:hypothetical protein
MSGAWAGSQSAEQQAQELLGIAENLADEKQALLVRPWLQFYQPCINGKPHVMADESDVMKYFSSAVLPCPALWRSLAEACWVRSGVALHRQQACTCFLGSDSFHSNHCNCQDVFTAATDAGTQLQARPRLSGLTEAVRLHQQSRRETRS